MSILATNTYYIVLIIYFKILVLLVNAFIKRIEDYYNLSTITMSIN